MITKSLLVRASPAKAFRVWTERIDLWWPRDHRMSGDPDGRMHMEAEVGGRFFERTPDGRELEYGRVVECEPPTLLAFTFFPGTGPDQPTRVEVRFTAEVGGTRVDLRHLPGGAEPEDFERTAPRFDANWTRMIRAYGDRLAATTPEE